MTDTENKAKKCRFNRKTGNSTRKIPVKLPVSAAVFRRIFAARNAV